MAVLAERAVAAICASGMSRMEVFGMIKGIPSDVRREVEKLHEENIRVNTKKCCLENVSISV